MENVSSLLAALTSLAVGAAGIIGALVTWRKAASDRTVTEANLAEERMRRQDERMDKMQALIDKLRRRDRILVSYVYGLQGQIVRLGADPPPWPAALDEETA